ncbi:MAG: hypothetical protein ABEJ34_02395, partial [Haloferacaceae archaeon]
AVDALARRDYEAAGDAYTRAGRRVLADPREGTDPFAPDEHGWVGHGLQHLVAAAMAYRVAGVETRATRRATEGEAAARDLEHALAAPAQHACLAEFAADFRAVADRDDAAAAYESAADAYRSAADAVDDPKTLITTPLFQAAAAPIRQAARGQADGEVAVEWSDLHGSDPSRPGPFLARRTRYKRQRFGSLVAACARDGYLAAPRGTTEYDNANHRCPACESTDVNWIGGAVLCLRCSAPMERR